MKWNEFQSNVSKTFSYFRNEENFFDVTLVSDDHQHIAAHKLVLSASSKFFKDILCKTQHSNPLIYLSGFSSKDLNLVMDYIYQGEVQIYQNQLDNFLDVAQKLKIEGLLSTEEPKTKQEPQFEDEKVESFPTEPDQVRPGHGENVSLKAEVEEKIQQLMEKRDGRHHCKACDYYSKHSRHIRDHVERHHIDGLSYP